MTLEQRLTGDGSDSASAKALGKSQDQFSLRGVSGGEELRPESIHQMLRAFQDSGGCGGGEKWLGPWWAADGWDA